MKTTTTTTASLREKAIERARARVQRDGFEGLRLSDVARDLGVTHAALYKYFADKQDLVDAINMQWMDEVNQRLRTICDTTDMPCTGIKQWFLELYALRRDKVLKNASEYASYIHTEELRRPCAQKDALERKQQLKGLIEAAIAEGTLQPDSPSAITAMLLHAADYYIHPAFVASHATEDKTADFAHLLDVLLRGLAPIR